MGTIVDTSKSLMDQISAQICQKDGENSTFCYKITDNDGKSYTKQLLISMANMQKEVNEYLTCLVNKEREKLKNATSTDNSNGNEQNNRDDDIDNDDDEEEEDEEDDDEPLAKKPKP